MQLFPIAVWGNLLLHVFRVYGPKGPVLGKKKSKKNQSTSSVNTVLDLQCLHVLSKRALPASGDLLTTWQSAYYCQKIHPTTEERTEADMRQTCLGLMHAHLH